MSDYSPPKGRQHTPVRHYEIDRMGSVASEVKVTKWSKEELEAYWRTLPPPPEPKRPNVRVTPPPEPKRPNVRVIR